MFKYFFLFITLIMHCAYANELEVLHWWTSNGEMQATKLLKKTMESQGYTWKDFAVAGGGGESAMAVLKARAVAGNPPTAAQIKGKDIQEWAHLGFLSTLTSVATQEKWDKVLPSFLKKIMLYKGQYVAVPINIHRVNWLWINPNIFKKMQLKIPTTLTEFFNVADKLKTAGYIPLAHGGQPWQDTTLFEIVALSVLSQDEYKQAFVDLNMQTLTSPKMIEVFRYFKKLHQYIDTNAPGRTWNQATQMLIKGDAAMQLMGDWVKGEFTMAHKKAGKDFICVVAPGTQGKFSYNIDSFVFFKNATQEQKGQEDIATSVMSKPFQLSFSLVKGSIPARNDISITALDSCSQQSMLDLHQAQQQGNLVPSLSQSMATTTYVQSAISEIVSEFFNNPNSDAKKAPQRLAKAIKAAL